MPPLNKLQKTGLALAISQAVFVPAHAANIIVTANTDDGNLCTLREALVSVNTGQLVGGCGNASGEAFGTNDSITFANAGEIRLLSGELSVSSDVDINASSVGGVTINAMQNSRVMSISDGPTVSLSSLTLTGGALESDSGGGLAVTGSGAAVNIVDTELSNNSASLGGGLFDEGANTITLTNSSVSGNEGGGLTIGINSVITLTESTVTNNSTNSGAGIAVLDSDITLIDTQVSGNTAEYGSGLLIGGGKTTILNSTISNNTAYAGVSIFHLGGTEFDEDVDSTRHSLILTNSTVSGNVGLVIGGINTKANTTLLHTTVANNTALYVTDEILPNGVYASASLTVINSILADSVGGDDCYVRGTMAVVSVDAQSIIESGDCGQTRFADPGLLPLANNGGPTQTHALKPNSIAIDTGDTATCLATDQRGEQRDANCDIGAFEFIDQRGFFVIPLKNGKTVVIPE